MKYKSFEVDCVRWIEDIINEQIKDGWEFVQVITSADGISTSTHRVLMRRAKENDPTEKLAATLRKTVENIKADPTNPVNIELTRILSNLKDGLTKKA